jgi:hypothetical protein
MFVHSDTLTRLDRALVGSRIVAEQQYTISSGMLAERHSRCAESMPMPRRWRWEAFRSSAASSPTRSRSLAMAAEATWQRSGKSGVDKTHELALLLGVIVFALPTVIVLMIMVPPRVRQIRQLGAANAALVDVHDPERRRLLAMRAAFGLSYLTLLSYTRDPLGDLAAARYDPLVAAALDDVGVRRPPGGPQTATPAPPV